MAKYSRIEVYLKMKETGVVPVFYHADIDVCKEVIHSCYKGGIRVFEFVNRGDFAHDIFSQLNKFVLKELPEMILGAGSIVDGDTASLYIQSGANFIVSPLLNKSIMKVCNRRKIMWSAGCGTVTEISKAQELGCEIVKLFPASEIGGPSFVKAVRGSMPWTDIMPTGGVKCDRENLESWFSSGVTCVGIGSDLFQKEIINTKNWMALTEKASELMGIIKSVR